MLVELLVLLIMELRIINCSVTDIRLLDISTSSTNLHIGGLVGYLG